MSLLLTARRTQSLARRRLWTLVGLLVTALLFVTWLMYRRLTRYDLPAVSVPEFLDLPAGQRVVWGPTSVNYQFMLPVLDAPDGLLAAAALGHFFPVAARRNLSAFSEAVELSISGRRLRAREQWRVDWALRSLPMALSSEAVREASVYVRQLGIAPEVAVRAQVATDLAAGVEFANFDGAPFIRGVAGLWGKQDPALASVLAAPGLRGYGETLRSSMVFVRIENRGTPYWKLTWPGVSGCLICGSHGGVTVIVIPFASSDIRHNAVAHPVAALAENIVARNLSYVEAAREIEATPTLGSATFFLHDSSTGATLSVVRTPSGVDTLRDVAVIDSSAPGTQFASDPLVDRGRRESTERGRRERFALAARTSMPTIQAGWQMIWNAVATPQLGHRGGVADLFSVATVVWHPVRRELAVSLGNGTGVSLRLTDQQEPFEGAALATPMEPLAILRLRESFANLVERGRRYGPRSVLLDLELLVAQAPGVPELLATSARAHLESGARERAAQLFDAWQASGDDDPRAAALLKSRLSPR